jgi:prepilin-type N-terminal cleavage/methylation domain-containing protein
MNGLSREGRPEFESKEDHCLCDSTRLLAAIESQKKSDMDHQSFRFLRSITPSQSADSHLSKKNGFSLIEVLIALILFAVGVLAIGAMQIGSIKGNSFSQEVTQATVLSQEKLEELRKMDFDDSNLSVGHHDEGVLSGSGFSRSYDVANTSPTLKTVMVTVRWTEEMEHSVSLSTMKAR